MVEVKSENLSGRALDWAVERSRGEHVLEAAYNPIYCPHYVGDWSNAGPIIEDEGVHLETDGREWFASFRDVWCANERTEKVSGNTPIEAAMRAFVILKIGKEIEVPEVLMEAQNNFGVLKP